jgi:phosphoglycolate phosphatase
MRECVEVPRLIRYLLFDFDGTLVDSRAVAFDILNEVAIRHGYPPIRHSEMAVLSRLPLKERLRQYGVPVYKVPKLALELRRRYGERLAHVPVYRGMVPVIRELNRKYRMSILSSNEPESIRHVLRTAGLELFDPIDASFNLFGKSAKIKSFLRKTGCARQELLYIGDELRDVEASREAGVRCVAVSWGFDSRELLKQGGPNFLIDRPEELPELLRRLKV